MLFSVVSTMYDSERYVSQFVEAVNDTIEKVSTDFEIILVDDGSPDNSLSVARNLLAAHAELVVVELSRNFGHHQAMMAGMKVAKGDYVFLIDIDLEEPVSCFDVFWEHMQRDHEIDVVYGLQQQRKGRWLERITGGGFYKVFNWFSNIKVPENFITARLMRRDYIDALLSFPEREIFIGGLWAATGFRQIGVVVEKRASSPSSYTLARKLSMTINAITSFSDLPLRLLFTMGMFVTLGSLLYVLWLIYKKLVLGVDLEGWVSIVASIWLTGGLIIFSIGIVGMYLSKVFSEVKRRPYPVVRKILRHSQSSDR